MIQLRDFGFRYREHAECAVHDVNLDIPERAFVGITGAAASGKSTLTYALNGMIPHCYFGDFYGSVVIDGVDTVEASLTEISRLVGSVCQGIESQIVTPLVEDEILYGLENFGVARDEGIARMEDVLGAMGIEELRSCEISSLSGGQKQKVAIASILALRPRVLVLDEPTAELDPAASRGVFDLLKQYSREHKVTVVAVEQKIALLCDYADMVVVMEEGSVRVSGTPDEVLVHAPELYAMGANVPRVTSLTRSLRDKGVYAGPVCRTVSQAALHIAQSLRAKGRAIPPDAAPSGSFAECVASCEKEAGKGERRTRRNEKAGLAEARTNRVRARLFRLEGDGCRSALLLPRSHSDTTASSAKRKGVAAMKERYYSGLQGLCVSLPRHSSAFDGSASASALLARELFNDDSRFDSASNVSRT